MVICDLCVFINLITLCVSTRVYFPTIYIHIAVATNISAANQGEASSLHIVHVVYVATEEDKQAVKKMTSVPILYCVDGSPPVRSVYLCLEALGLHHIRKQVNVLKKEQMSPEFLKINPQHTVPTLDDNGFVIWDSHAINAYLSTQYGKDDSLYPTDPKKRALVDQRLYFDSGVLFPLFREISTALFTLKNIEIPVEIRRRVNVAYDFMEEFLEGRDYLAGDNYTIADFCCVATIATLVEVMGLTLDGHPKVKAWLQRCKSNLPGYSASQDRGIRALKAMANRARNRNVAKL